MTKVVRHITCGYEDTDLNVIQSMTSCGHIQLLTCKGCRTITNEFEVVEIDRDPYQPTEKYEGFTKEEIQDLINAAGGALKIESDWEEEGHRTFIALVMHRPNLPNHTHTAFEKKGDLYDIWYIVPGFDSIRFRAKCWGKYKIKEETITELT